MDKRRLYILVINAKPNALIFKIFQRQSLTLAVSGQVEGIGTAKASVSLVEHSSQRMVMKNFPQGLASQVEALTVALAYLRHWQAQIGVIGHYFAYGGVAFAHPTIVGLTNIEELAQINTRAPRQNPLALTCLQTCLAQLPKIQNVAVFGTAFNKMIPPTAHQYALPADHRQPEIRKFSFDGIIHHQAARAAAAHLKKSLKRLRLVSCHVNDSSSVGAIKSGHLMAGTLGFTPDDGLISLSGSGAVDHSLVLYLMRKFNLTITGVDELLNERSGLSVVSGITGPLSDILAAAGYPSRLYQPARIFRPAERRSAQMAINGLTHQLLAQIGSAIILMGGVDYLVFSGDVGKANPALRQLVTKTVRKTVKKIKAIAVDIDLERLVAEQAARPIPHDK